MGNMEGKELTHLQEPKLAGREDQGNNNLHDEKRYRAAIARQEECNSQTRTPES
jgi:hypothetical protein